LHLFEIPEPYRIILTQAKISGQSTIWFTYPVRAEIDHLEIEPQAMVKFKSFSLLIYTILSGTDLRLIDFENVKWHRYWGRNVVYDEILLRENKENSEYAQIENLYRQLKINYKKQEDFKKVGDFHYGEMEMHRRASRWRWFPFFWYNLYWGLSGYGERPSRAMCWMAAFTAVLTGLLAWAGLEILDANFSAGFGNSFFYLLQKVTLQRPTWAVPQGFWGKLVAGFSVLLIPGQAALFLLALRNRLGRRR
jgi:hypothetical protein